MRFIQVLSFIVFLLGNQATLQAQNCVLNCPANMVVQAEKGKEGAIVHFPAFTAAADCGSTSFSPASGSFFRLGSHSIIITSTSGKKCSFTVTVTDNESPILSPITLSRQMLWPESHKLKKVKVGYTVADNGENVKTSLAITSNSTDGVKDWEFIDNHLVRLKSSRLPDGSPRVYTITVTATDDAGNKTSRSTTIAVSNTMIAKPSM